MWRHTFKPDDKQQKQKQQRKIAECAVYHKNHLRLWWALFNNQPIDWINTQTQSVGLNAIPNYTIDSIGFKDFTYTHTHTMHGKECEKLCAFLSLSLFICARWTNRNYSVPKKNIDIRMKIDVTYYYIKNDRDWIILAIFLCSCAKCDRLRWK